MRKLILLICFIGALGSKASMPYRVDQANQQPLTSMDRDTTGKFRFTCQWVRSCQAKEDPCIGSVLEEVKKMSKSSYVIAYLKGKNTWKIETDKKKFSKILKDKNIKDLAYGVDNITIMDKAYPDKKYVVVIQFKEPNMDKLASLN